MNRPAVLFPFAAACLLLLGASLPAQKTLADVQRQFAEQARALDAQRPNRDQRIELIGRQAEALQKWLASDAAGDDRWNGRLMLADMQMARREREPAIAALQGITNEAPPLVLVSAAGFAQRLGMKGERDAWLAAALAKEPAPGDRLAMARLLAVVLHEFKASDELFAKALAAAGDDEQRAFVRWHVADALRDREDLPDNAAFDELEKLASDLPATYWGGVAKDLLRATKLKPGDDAIAFTAKTRAGDSFALAEQKGKVVVLAFWSAADPDVGNLVTALQGLRRAFPDKLVLLGVCCDPDPARIDAAIKGLGIDFPVVGDGKGFQTDAALRWFVSAPTVHVIDKQGKVAVLNQHAGTRTARADLEAAVTDAVKRE